MSDHDLKKLMDACRSESADLHEAEMSPLKDALAKEPQLREMFERSQRMDGRIRGILQDVDVPASLQQRLLDGARNAAQSAEETKPSTHTSIAAGAAAAVAAESESSEASAPSELVKRSTPPADTARGRPWWIVAAGSTAVALLLAASVVIGIGGRSLSEEQLVLAAADWTKRAMDSEAWQHARDHALPADRPLSGAVHREPRKWLRMAVLDDPRAVAYEVNPVGDSFEAKLFVIKTQRNTGLSSVPYQQLSTGGTASGLRMVAWQNATFLYVLVIPSDGPSPERYVEKLRAV